MAHTTIPSPRSGARALTCTALAAAIFLNAPAALGDPIMDAVAAVIEAAVSPRPTPWPGG
ncbi:hypothetical protein [Nocardia sp. BMG51109]|uniref:hypothetical protein n=1 Tax=Nocardia sp. BMG51109 TaxID=1056816 RepID=UPI00046333C6|nr:hypothetical protein [Nocardia sp. BMG51109]